MTGTCPLCGSAGYDPLNEPIPQPATASRWAIDQAKRAAEEAIRSAKERRTTVNETEEKS